MKRVLLAAFAAGLVWCAAASVAGVYTFSPAPPGLRDLSPNYWYTWGIDWQVPADETITSARLVYYQIYDLNVEPDHLYTTLLDWAPAGVQTGFDFQGQGNHFAGQGLLLGDWDDPDGPYSTTNLIYDIPSANYVWLCDGNFGFGIDPDRFYRNCGVRLKVTTEPTVIPEPFSVALASLGLVAVAGYRRLRTP